MKRQADQIDSTELGDGVEAELRSLMSSASSAAEAFKMQIAEFERRRLLLEDEKKRLLSQTQKDGAQVVNAMPPRIVKLNVGGKRIDVSRRTVTQIPSRLAWILSGRWDHLLLKDKDGRLFLDFDPEWFDPIINHLRELVLKDPQTQISPPTVSAEHEAGYNLLLEFFGLEAAFGCPSGQIMGQQYRVPAEPLSIATVLPFSSRYTDGEVAARFSDVTVHLEAMDRFGHALLEKGLILHKQFKELETDEEDLRKEVDFMSSFSHDDAGGRACEGDVLYFNVGGTPICVSKKTLKQAPDSMLCAQYATGRWECGALDLDDSGAIFLDHNATFFARILSKLRFMVLSKLADAGKDAAATKARQFIVRVDSSQRASFNRMLNYFQLDRRLFNGIDSAIAEVETFLDILESWTSTEAGDWELLLRGSRDGFSAAEFHRRCDGKTNTLVIARDTAGSVFGGFADVAWQSSNTYIHSIAAFLFTLSLHGAQNKVAARQCKLIASMSHAIYGGQNYHATFGAGHDLHLCDNCAHASGSYSNLGNSYQNHGNIMLLCGMRNFQVSELEVFQIRK